MVENFYTIITKIGKAKIANATALGVKLNIVKFAVGDGNGSYYNPVEEQEELKNEVWRGNVNSIDIDKDNPNWIVAKSVIMSSEGGFMMREAGLFDEAGDMIAIGKYPETYKPLMAEGSAKDLYVKMIIEVSNASNVTLKIDPTVILATQKDIKNLQEQIDNLSSDTVSDKEIITINHGLNCYPIVRLISTNYGAGIGQAGETPAGGTESYLMESKICYLDKDNIKIYVPKKYSKDNASVEKLNDKQYILTFDNEVESILIDLLEVA
ncbi:phage tail protein [Clostridium tyrobutyricum]|uniref:phage tail-collar fiber domain-containing protein n=1 Tax=Clostridium tyrobutyricum TaxID=1519 RepID=UPI00073D4046|nr:phage tail protein [Clostridium tyrobutyricum]